MTGILETLDNMNTIEIIQIISGFAAGVLIYVMIFWQIKDYRWSKKMQQKATEYLTQDQEVMSEIKGECHHVWHFNPKDETFTCKNCKKVITCE
ncbi:hypothetical protein GWK08_08940 [Leptobacterium flavescens]|uniref:Uncharacterized protein n=1 Tax=Leptobacterium flavescens TaxID=472055 RepID=A0A6P0UM92_9FLAO|nr:hypothetical protein [Leptobacterium flavescens]NER13560.1 hypothetical protein [Leptobacterium flavescens]